MRMATASAGMPTALSPSSAIPNSSLLGTLDGARARDTVAFTEKVNEATQGQFQITTDGFKAYIDAIHMQPGNPR